MNKSKLILAAAVLIISSVVTVLTMYLYGSWQHDRYWNGTIKRVNQTESSVYINLLTADLKKIYSEKDFYKLKEMLEPLDGKLIIKLTDNTGKTVFESSTARHELGPILQQSEINSGTETFSIQVISYLPPSWKSQYIKWFSNYSDWFSMKYDRITMPSIAFFFIWSLFFTVLIWRYKAHLASDRLFHALREFNEDNDEDERK